MELKFFFILRFRISRFGHSSSKSFPLLNAQNPKKHNLGKAENEDCYKVAKKSGETHRRHCVLTRSRIARPKGRAKRNWEDKKKDQKDRKALECSTVLEDDELRLHTYGAPDGSADRPHQI